MTRRRFSRLPALMAVALLAGAAFPGCGGRSGTMEKPRDVVVITPVSGEAVTIQVEVADTPELRSHGLMYRSELPEGTGMLFVFPKRTRGSFWMKNTPISLDMLFAKDDTIVATIENTVPYDETFLTPDASYTMTLEVPGGYAQRHGIHIGDRMEWKRPATE